MTGRTHRLGGVVCCLGGFMVLKNQGMILTDVNPALQVAVMYPFAIYGSVVSDLDHGWKSAPSKDVISFLINKLLHIVPSSKKTYLNAKHRSWQTHSDLFLMLMLFTGMILLNTMPSSADQVIIQLMFTGLVLGITSHLILDMLTPQGIWSIGLLGLVKLLKLKGIPVKLSFVPSNHFFATDGKWEEWVRKMLWVVSFILLGILVVGFI